VAAAEATGYAFRATWRTEGGELVSSSDPATMCRNPRMPWVLRAVREGYAHIIPCMECPGCLEFERRRLAGRLTQKYSTDLSSARGAERRGQNGSRTAGATTPTTLYLIRIYAPLADHAALSHRLHRRRGLELEPGYWRLGADSFALISRSRRLPPFTLRGTALRVRVESILLRRGRRAWRALTAGILVARQVYGEQLNRWYCRGLPPAEKEKWEVDRHAAQKGYQRTSSPRAWKNGQLVLVPPDVWRLGRADRRRVRRDLAAATNPEGVARVMEIVHSALEKRDLSALISPAARPVLTSDQVKQWYADMATRKAANAERERTDFPAPPPSEGEAYISSGHSTGAGPPRTEAGERLRTGVEPWTPLHLPKLPEDDLTELTPKQWLHRKTRRELDAQLERMRKKIQEGGR
jgi:hypothetical protein